MLRTCKIRSLSLRLQLTSLKWCISLVWWIQRYSFSSDGIYSGQYLFVRVVHGLWFVSHVYSIFSSLTFAPGSWFLTYGATLQPFYNAAGFYAPDAYGFPAQEAANLTQAATQEWGELSPQFHASFGEQVFVALQKSHLTLCQASLSSSWQFSASSCSYVRFVLMSYWSCSSLVSSSASSLLQLLYSLKASRLS